VVRLRRNPHGPFQRLCRINFGSIYFKAAAGPIAPPFGPDIAVQRHSYDWPEWRWWHPLYFTQNTGALFHIIRIPLWSLIIPAAAATLMLSSRRRRDAFAARTSACPHCLYSRTGLDPESKCPECGGTPPPHP
jgi:hypothetical protein